MGSGSVNLDLCPTEVGQRRYFSWPDVRQHASMESCWVVLYDAVVDVTEFLSDHPGGAAALGRVGRAGTDVTAHFERIGHSSHARDIVARLTIGVLEDVDASEVNVRDGGIAAAATEAELTERNDIEEAPLISAEQGKGTPADWHARRRAAMLDSACGIELKALMLPLPWTLLLGLAVCSVHAWLSLVVQHLPWWATVLLAYSIGAVCKMYQFMVAHEICHGNVMELLRDPVPRSLAMHVCTLPSVGSSIHQYYEYMHLGHHRNMGTPDWYQDKLSLVGIIVDKELDGDSFTVNTMKLLLLRQKGVPQVFQKWRALIVALDPAIHLAHFLTFIGWDLFALAPAAFGWACWRTLIILYEKAPEVLESKWFGDFAKEVGRLGVENKEWILGGRDLVVHPWLWLTVLVLLMRTAPHLSAAFHTLMYLILSELFMHGFFWHPYIAYFLGVHRTTKISLSPLGEEDDDDDGTTSDRQPTRSAYSWVVALATGNLNYHCEHHDFPNVPWWRLPKVRAAAPEWYENLDTWQGLGMPFMEYLREGHTWRYARYD